LYRVFSGNRRPSSDILTSRPRGLALRAPALPLSSAPTPASLGGDGQNLQLTAQPYSFRALIPVRNQVQHMAPWTWLLGLLLVAQSLASSFTTMSVQGRPKADARSDVALEYVSARTLSF